MMIVITPPLIKPTVGSGAPETGSGAGGAATGVFTVVVVFGVDVGVTVGPQLHVSTAVHPGLRHMPLAQIKSDGQSLLVLHFELHVGPQVQVSTAVQPGRRQRPDSQMRSDGHIAFEVHSVLQATTGVAVGVGVGVGVGVAVGQTQVSDVVQLGLRQAPLVQVIVAGQSFAVTQVVPHCGTGVGVGVGVGVAVATGATVKSNVHELFAAAGFDCGALGATVSVVVEVRLVTQTTMPAPASSTAMIAIAMMMRFRFILTKLPIRYMPGLHMVDTALYMRLQSRLRADQRRFDLH